MSIGLRILCHFSAFLFYVNMQIIFVELMVDQMKYEKLDGTGERKLIRRIRDIVSMAGGQQLTLDDSAMLVKHPGPCSTWVTTDPCPFPNLVHPLLFFFSTDFVDILLGGYTP